MNVKRLMIGAAFALALPAAASAGPLDGIFGGIFDTDSGYDLPENGIQFMNSLHEGYVQLSDSRDSAFDFIDAELFNHKARTAARRSLTLPDEITDRDLDPNDAAELSVALLRLRRAFVMGGREVAPVDSAYAQVGYDCWIEAAEAGRDEDVEMCRRTFEERIGRVENQANFGIREVKGPPAPVPVPERLEAYLIYFQFDTTIMTADGRATMDAAISTALAEPDIQIKLIGHADRAGSIPYNQALSERRSRVVRERLVEAGVNPARIMADAVGETMPKVPTPDGVRDPRNRVVEIEFL